MDFVDGSRVHRLLPFPELVEALAEAHRGPQPAVDRSLLESRDGPPGEAFVNWPAWHRGEAFGVKMVTVLPDNSRRGAPSVHALYQLFDGATGAPSLTIEGESLTLRKTAADSALGARFLAREDAATMLMIGAGALAPYLVRAHLSVRPSLSRVLVWNRSDGRAKDLAGAFAREGVDARATTDLEAGLGAADVISCATMATEPLVRGKRLKPGAHVDLVGGFTPDMREADDDTMRRGSVFVDSRRFTIGCVGDITAPMVSGAIAEKDILADLFDLCRGEHPGRRSADEVTVFKNAGGAHLDLFTAAFLRRRIEEDPEVA